MPQFYRIAFNEGISWDPTSDKGGCRNFFHFSAFKNAHANKGLFVRKSFIIWQKYYKMIEALKNDGNHITELLSMSDMIQLGGICAVEYCGGPKINFR